MADGANYTKYAAPALATLMGAEWGGKVRAMHETYSFASAAIGTLVNVGVLKKDEVFLAAVIIGADLGSATTLQLGDAGDDDRYLAATVFTTAGQATWALKVDGVGYKATADTPLVVKTGAEEATGAIEVIIFKACPN